jgi:hypothetical protein
MSVLRRADRVEKVFQSGETQWIHLGENEYKIAGIISSEDQLSITYLVREAGGYWEDRYCDKWIETKEDIRYTLVYVDDYLTIS